MHKHCAIAIYHGNNFAQLILYHYLMRASVRASANEYSSSDQFQIEKKTQNILTLRILFSSYNIFMCIKTKQTEHTQFLSDNRIKAKKVLYTICVFVNPCAFF